MTSGDWNGSTEEKKFWSIGNVFIKSTLREKDWQISYTGEKHKPKMAIERAKNEAANINFIRQYTNVPVPEILCEYEDDGAYVIVMTRASGVSMDTLDPTQKAVVMAKIPTYMDSLHRLESSKLGGASGIVCPPYSVLNQIPHDKCRWPLKDADSDIYSFCHMDAHQGNIFVDPETLEITCFIDFEFAGFYPVQFDLPRYKYDICQQPNLDKFTQEFISFLESQRYGLKHLYSRGITKAVQQKPV